MKTKLRSAALLMILAIGMRTSASEAAYHPDHGISVTTDILCGLIACLEFSRTVTNSESVQYQRRPWV